MKPIFTGASSRHDTILTKVVPFDVAHAKSSLTYCIHPLYTFFNNAFRDRTALRRYVGGKQDPSPTNQRPTVRNNTTNSTVKAPQAWGFYIGYNLHEGLTR